MILVGNRPLSIVLSCIACLKCPLMLTLGGKWSPCTLIAQKQRYDQEGLSFGIHCIWELIWSSVVDTNCNNCPSLQFLWIHSYSCSFAHPGIVRLLIIAVYVVSVLYSHCPYAVVASRSMAIVVDPQLKLIMFLFLSCNVLCSQCSLPPCSLLLVSVCWCSFIALMSGCVHVGVCCYDKLLFDMAI